MVISRAREEVGTINKGGKMRDDLIEENPEPLASRQMRRMGYQRKLSEAREVYEGGGHRCRNSFKVQVQNAYRKGVDPIKELESALSNEIKWILGEPNFEGGEWAKVIRYANCPEEYIGCCEKMIDAYDALSR